VPVRTQVLEALESAGFVGIQLQTFRSTPCFQQDGVELRETRIVCRRPAVESEERCDVVFKGPFAALVDDAGHQWRRGERINVSVSQWESLSRSPYWESFVRMPAEATATACGV
jgi:hypothetical protein